MTVDVVVVTYQSAEHLPACLASVPAGCRPTVVDNASADGSASVAEALGASVIRNDANLGFGAAAGQGARTGDGELVLFLNPDAELAPGGLETLAAAFEADPRLGIAGPQLSDPSGAPQRSWWPFPSPGRTWLEAFGIHLLVKDEPGPGQRVPFVVGACMLVRREVFEELGGFDPGFWLYGEESDLCRRAWDAGWEVRIVLEARATHVGGASGAGDRDLGFEHLHRGAETFILKHHGRAGLVAHRLGLLVGSLLRLPSLALRRTPDSPSRLAQRRTVVARMARTLATHPTRLAG
jgi:N-acetylglucosaminyl-diphospho-decaprenol L-rhamnosyltransferase